MSILPGVAHLSFPNRKEMTLSLCRAQEYYEAASEALRGKYFSWESFLDSFVDSGGNVSYFSFWSGFNLPGETYLEFLTEFSSDLSRREMAVREAVIGVVDPSRAFYVIGTLDGAVGTLNHEMLHALFHVNDSYRDNALELVSKLNQGIDGKLRKGLSELGYGGNVMADEIQAYLGCGEPDELLRRFDLSLSDCETHCAPFRDLASGFLQPIVSQE